MKREILKFPDRFLWGAGTSAHQVEGGNTNDWSQWELRNCTRLASAARPGFCSAKKHALPPGAREKIKSRMQDPANYVSGLACGHYDRFTLDFALAKKLNHTAHRFSIEWSRIEPEEGKFNQTEIEHYRKVILSLKELEIEPFVTLWHFTNPIWFLNRGGWKSNDAAQYFLRYVYTVVESLKREIRFWITLNEPIVFATSSYLLGKFPAQEKNPRSFSRAVSNFAMAHRSAYEAIKKVEPEAQVGIAKSIIHFDAYKKRAVNRLLKKAADHLWNNSFVDRINPYQDFIGVNHYFHNRINFGFNKNDNRMLSDMGWELYPDAIYHCLKEMGRYARPLYITENGLADSEDDRRTWYIREILKNVHRAIREGVDVKGYFYWSLLDNFEWHKGFWPRFGLVEVDYISLERKVRKSAVEYAKIIKYNGLEISDEQRAEKSVPAS